MAHIEFIVMLFTILCGFVAGTVSLLYFLKSKSDFIKRYLHIFLSLAAFHLMGFAYQYLSSTSLLVESNIFLVLVSILYAIITFYVVSLLRISQLMLKAPFFKIALKLTPLVFALTYLFSLSWGTVSEISYRALDNLWLTGMFTQLPAFLLTIILMWRKHKNIPDPAMSKLARGLVILVAAYFPFMIIESVIINIYDWYPVDTNLKVFHLTFIIWCVYSSYIFIQNLQQNNPISASMLQYNISNRENEILGLIDKDFSVQEIADTLFISPRTVEKHITNIYKKTGVNTRKDLLELMQTSRELRL